MRTNGRFSANMTIGVGCAFADLGSQRVCRKRFWVTRLAAVFAGGRHEQRRSEVAAGHAGPPRPGAGPGGGSAIARALRRPTRSPSAPPAGTSAHLRGAVRNVQDDVGRRIDQDDVAVDQDAAGALAPRQAGQQVARQAPAPAGPAAVPLRAGSGGQRPGGRKPRPWSTWRCSPGGRPPRPAAVAPTPAAAVMAVDPVAVVAQVFPRITARSYSVSIRSMMVPRSWAPAGIGRAGRANPAARAPASTARRRIGREAVEGVGRNMAISPFADRPGRGRPDGPTGLLAGEGRSTRAAAPARVGGVADGKPGDAKARSAWLTAPVFPLRWAKGHVHSKASPDLAWETRSP